MSDLIRQLQKAARPYTAEERREIEGAEAYRRAQNKLPKSQRDYIQKMPYQDGDAPAEVKKMPAVYSKALKGSFIRKMGE